MVAEIRQGSRRSWLVASASICLAFATAASAHDGQEAYGPQFVHLSIVETDTGATKKVYYHNRRYFVAARSGEPYALHVENLSNERVLVILSVDGINVLSGETAAVSQTGYIFAPHESYDLRGWRKTRENVAQFRFAPLSRSYAARTGRPGDVGVIGMAVFREAVPPPPPPPPPTAFDERSDGPAPMAQALPPPPLMRQQGAMSSATDASSPAPLARSEKLGTAHGEIVENAVGPDEDFVRRTSQPEELRLVEYDSGENLVAAGVIPRSQLWPRPPRAFPGSGEQRQFVPDPPR